ncbi:MAG: tyrosine-type recombinase/integrase [Acidiferrobacter sp.]
MATFIQRPGPSSGKHVWQVKIRRRGFPALSGTFDTKGKAEAWARKTESEMDRGVFVSLAEAESTTLAKALDRYTDEISATKKTANREIYTIRWWRASSLGPRSLASIRGKDIAALLSEKEAEGAAPHTIHLYLALLSHVFTVARKRWGIEGLANPAELVHKPRLPPGRDRRLVDDEYPRLLSAALTYGGDIAPLITWAIETAMRRSEIAAMRWEHLDRKARVLLLPETKNGTPRRVPLSVAALGVLDGLPRRIDGRVWGMRPDSISQAFERVCEASGIEGLTFHDLRHEATSRLFEKGLNPMQVAAITGHKTLQMLKRYTHLRAEDLVGMLG